MKKPEKKRKPRWNDGGGSRAIGEWEGYNQACDDWEKWLRVAAEELIQRLERKLK
jgi:hypothetical protein